MDEIIRDGINTDIDDNIKYLKELLKDNTDIVIREFFVVNVKCCLVYVDGMGDKNLIDLFVLQPLMRYEGRALDISIIKDRITNVSEIAEKSKLSEGIIGVLSGDTLLLVQGSSSCLVIGSRLWPTRGIAEPSSETVIKGSREGFSETLRFNSALIRRRVRDTRLRTEHLFIGRRSKSDTLIVYIQDIVNKEVLSLLKERLDGIDIDAIFDSGVLEEFLEDNKYSPFPQIQYTERPDVVAAALYEGRIAVLIDNTPSALIVPAGMSNLFQSPDDYNGRWLNASFVRLIRIFSIFLSLVMPSLYIAVTSFNTYTIPTKLAYSIAATREGVPFPSFVEVILMEFFLAMLTEAIVRLPKPVGATIGIVGGLIVGQSAVSAGIVSPIMIIIVSITTISGFLTTNNDITSAFRFYRYMLIIFSSIAGLYGMVVGLILLSIQLLQLKSFGIPYMAPAVNPDISDFKDFLIRLPYILLRKRPKHMNTGDKMRQKKKGSEGSV